MNEKGHYFIKNKDYNKFAFEYYLITQVNSELQTGMVVESFLVFAISYLFVMFWFRFEIQKVSFSRQKMQSQIQRHSWYMRIQQISNAKNFQQSLKILKK